MWGYFSERFSPIATERLEGLCLVAPPRPFPADPIPPVKAVGAEWIAAVPYAYSLPGKTFVRYNHPRQWWGERREGCKATILKAKSAGLKVMLKPQVYVPGSWPGGITFDQSEDWRAWEDNYRTYLLDMARLADSTGVDLLCIGTEFKSSSRERPDFWRSLIREVRNHYSGPLTYAANWDEFESISWWGELDYLGIDAYFPLVNEATPSLGALRRAWRPWRQRIEKIQRRFQKPILFTEYGYLSTDYTAFNTWEREAEVHQLSMNEQAQANALEALFQTFHPEPWWAGGFLWKWFPNMEGHEGYPEKDYTPQGKLGEEVLRRWYLEKLKVNE